MQRLELTVHGAVQGVNFRAATAAKARELRLTGLVRNEPDGSVIIVAEGPQEKLRELLRWAKAGPPAAKVDRHDVNWSAPIGQFEDFSVMS